jgi:hypothetical protein
MEIDPFPCISHALGLLQYLVEKGGSHAAQSTNVNGHLPLHYACERAASLEVIEYLVDLWGEAVKSADSDGDLPLSLARQKVVRFLAEQWLEPPTKNPGMSLAKIRHHSTWLGRHDNGFRWKDTFGLCQNACR